MFSKAFGIKWTMYYFQTVCTARNNLIENVEKPEIYSQFPRVSWKKCQGFISYCKKKFEKLFDRPFSSALLLEHDSHTNKIIFHQSNRRTVIAFQVANYLRKRLSSSNKYNSLNIHVVQKKNEKNTNWNENRMFTYLSPSNMIIAIDF